LLHTESTICLQKPMNESVQADSRRLAAAGILLLCSLFWLVIAFRFISFPFLIGAWFLFFKRGPAVRPAIMMLLLFVPLTFSPLDIFPLHRSWPPKIVPLVMGRPRAETVERAKKGEVFLGGCFVSGFEPKYYLVW
jgi:hypothetical protein